MKRFLSNIDEEGEDERINKRKRTNSPPLSPSLIILAESSLTSNEQALASHAGISNNFDYLTLWTLLRNPDTATTTARDHNLPEDALDWTGWLSVDSSKCMGGGGFGDVYMGIWHDIPDHVDQMPEVVLKVSRPGRIGSRKERKRYKV